ncbi:outer membrane protein OmpK [Shigella flexneri]
MLGGEKFTLTNWNEYEFDRDATYAAGNGGKEGLNGAVALWWNATSHITTGLGLDMRMTNWAKTLPDAIIYSIKFNF